MNLLAIDPGTFQSAYVHWAQGRVIQKGIVPNPEILDVIQGFGLGNWENAEVVIEGLVSYGMPIGQDTLDTAVWAGRFYERAQYSDLPVNLIRRPVVKIHHCRDSRAKDKNIRQALVDKYGKPSTKADPNPVYGGDHKDKMRSHLWSAFAIATAVSEIRAEGREPEFMTI